MMVQTCEENQNYFFEKLTKCIAMICTDKEILLASATVNIRFAKPQWKALCSRTKPSRGADEVRASTGRPHVIDTGSKLESTGPSEGHEPRGGTKGRKGYEDNNDITTDLRRSPFFSFSNNKIKLVWNL